MLGSHFEEQLRNVERVQATSSAFAALLEDGSVVTWGDPGFGGDSSAVRDELKDVQEIQASERAFAAIREDRTVVAWGAQSYGGELQRGPRSFKECQGDSVQRAGIRSYTGRWPRGILGPCWVWWRLPVSETAAAGGWGHPCHLVCLWSQVGGWLHRHLGRPRVWWGWGSGYQPASLETLQQLELLCCDLGGWKCGLLGKQHLWWKLPIAIYRARIVFCWPLLIFFFLGVMTSSLWKSWVFPVLKGTRKTLGRKMTKLRRQCPGPADRCSGCTRLHWRLRGHQTQWQRHVLGKPDVWGGCHPCSKSAQDLGNVFWERFHPRLNILCPPSYSEHGQICGSISTSHWVVTQCPKWCFKASWVEGIACAHAVQECQASPSLWTCFRRAPGRWFGCHLGRSWVWGRQQCSPWWTERCARDSGLRASIRSNPRRPNGGCLGRSELRWRLQRGPRSFKECQGDSVQRAGIRSYQIRWWHCDMGQRGLWWIPVSLWRRLNSPQAKNATWKDMSQPFNSWKHFCLNVPFRCFFFHVQPRCLLMDLAVIH